MRILSVIVLGIIIILIDDFIWKKNKPPEGKG